MKPSIDCQRTVAGFLEPGPRKERRPNRAEPMDENIGLGLGGLICLSKANKTLLGSYCQDLIKGHFHGG